jgi:hypothetical protein
MRNPHVQASRRRLSMTRTTIVMAAALALAATLPAVQVQAQSSIRAYVSTTGSDSNPCSITQPCRHFSAALAVTATGGEVDALDPGGYGSFTISQAITIEGEGWSYVAPPDGGNGITINAVSGSNVIIRGVSINGVGTTGGTNGIVFNSGGGLVVLDCVVQNFPLADNDNGNGIVIELLSGAIGVAITNTIISNNGAFGIYYSPGGSATANVVIDHVVVTNNLSGIFLENFAGPATIAISNSIVSNNSQYGIYFINGSGSLQGSIDNSSINGNGFAGIDAEASSDLEIGRSVITYNGTGILNDRVYSYLDNRINSNSHDIGGSNGTTLTQSHALQ